MRDKGLRPKRVATLVAGSPTGAELDLLNIRGRRRIGIEVKRTTAPKVTPSIRSTLRDLGLAEVIVVHAGRESYALGAKVRGVAAARLDTDLGL